MQPRMGVNAFFSGSWQSSYLHLVNTVYLQTFWGISALFKFAL